MTRTDTFFVPLLPLLNGTKIIEDFMKQVFPIHTFGGVG